MNSDLRQRGPIVEMRRIVSKEGIGALWKGVGPASVRAAALTASQLATYDESKQVNMKYAVFWFDLKIHKVISKVVG